MQTASINKIIDMSLVDGPGNRTAIFFQGCNLHCQFCHNPETISLCNQCGLCISKCPNHALECDAQGEIVWRRERCDDCGACYSTCPFSATPRIRKMTVEDVFRRITKNKDFIRGITVSGGEATLHRDFLVPLFERVKGIGLTTLIDSNGRYPIYADEALLAVTDGVMLDIKSMNACYHQILTSAPLEPILANLTNLARRGKLEEIRTVVLPGDDWSEETVLSVLDYIEPYLDIKMPIYRLIKFRPIGVRGAAKGLPSPSDEKMRFLKSLLNARGFENILIT